MNELRERFQNTKNKYLQITERIDKVKIQTQLQELESASLKSDFWSDVLKAQNIMQKISALKDEFLEITELEERITTLSELLDLPEEETKNLHLDKELNDLESKTNTLEKRLFLSGKYDENDCFLSIHAGQGGVEAMDWAAMLTRMYQRYCEKKGWTITLIDETKGEEAGIKSVTLQINGRFAYGLLKKESGTHRLVRLSPFNADNLRQTSFALVEILPVLEEGGETEINEKDLEFDTFRSSGPGGQNVQKVSSAVRVKHLPTGITVECQSERSQYQNKENALKILRAKLFQLEEEKRRKEGQKLKDWEKTASWGTQIRSYVLHPYKLVKDLRTNFETSNAEGVLDGDIDEFVEAELKL